MENKIIKISHIPSDIMNNIDTEENEFVSPVEAANRRARLRKAFAQMADKKAEKGTK